MYKTRIKEKWWFSQCGRTNPSWTPLCDFKWAKNSSPNTNDIYGYNHFILFKTVATEVEIKFLSTWTMFPSFLPLFVSALFSSKQEGCPSTFVHIMNVQVIGGAQPCFEYFNRNNKCFLSSNLLYYYDFWRSCDTEDWRNDAGNTALITEINYILKHVQIKKFFDILIIFHNLCCWSNKCHLIINIRKKSYQPQTFEWKCIVSLYSPNLWLEVYSISLFPKPLNGSV